MKKLLSFLLSFTWVFCFAQEQTITADQWTLSSGLQVNSIVTGNHAPTTDVGFWAQTRFVSKTITTTSAGRYFFTFSFATDHNGNTYEVRDGSNNVLASLTINSTGNYQNFAVSTHNNITLANGSQTLKIVCTSANSGADLEYVKFRPYGIPAVNAGTDQVVTGIHTGEFGRVDLTGSATDDDGTISSYAWTKISGPSGSVIGTPTTPSTSITNLQPGTYVFRLTATDNSANTGSDDIQVLVNLCGVTRTVILDPGGENQDYNFTNSSFDMFRSKAANPGFYVYHYDHPIINPGDTVTFGRKKVAQIRGYGYPGTFDCPITFRNQYPDTVLEITKGIFLDGCPQWIITGRSPTDHDSTHTPLATDWYGIHIGDTSMYRWFPLPTVWTQTGVDLYANTDHIKIDRVKFENVGYFGKFKTDPMQDGDEHGGDPAFDYPFVMRGLKVMSCWGKNCNQDGWYIGNTAPVFLRAYTRGGLTVFLYPNAIDSIEFAYNYWSDVGRSCIQCARTLIEPGEGNSIHHQVLNNIGLERSQSQGNGIIDAGMSEGIQVHHNTVNKTWLYNYEMLGAVGKSGNFHDNGGDSAGFVDHTTYLWTMFRDMDSLKTAEGGRIDYLHIGNFLKNVDAGGVYNMVAVVDSTFPYRNDVSITIRDNVFKLNTRTDGYSIAFPGTWKGHLEEWNGLSQICNNKKGDGSPVTIYRDIWAGAGRLWPDFSINCSFFKEPVQFRLKGHAIQFHN